MLYRLGHILLYMQVPYGTLTVGMIFFIIEFQFSSGVGFMFILFIMCVLLFDYFLHNVTGRICDSILHICEYYMSAMFYIVSFEAIDC